MSSLYETFAKFGVIERLDGLDAEAKELRELLAEALHMAKVHVGTVAKKDIDKIGEPVHFIRVESDIVEDLITMLGVRPNEPTRIRAGFMLYMPKREATKERAGLSAGMLFFSRTKFDLPGQASAKQD